VAEHVELAAGDAQWLLLQGVGPVIRDEEADEVTGRPDGQLPEAEPGTAVDGVGIPRAERAGPGQVEEVGGPLSEAEPRERGNGRRVGAVGQSFFRR
jgi:hypothetical protein